MMQARREAPSLDEQIDRQVRQSYYVAASRHLSQIAGILLMLLHDRDQHRAGRHLPALLASANRLADDLTANPIRMDRHLLAAIEERLAAVRRWLAHLPSQGSVSETEIGAALDELQRLRDRLLAAGKQSCQFGMVHFAAGCCCGQHPLAPVSVDAGLSGVGA